MDLLTRFTDFLNSPQYKLSSKTVKNYRTDVNSFISWYKKQYNQELEVAPTNITSQIVEVYKRAKIQESNLSGNSLKRHISSLRKFFQFLKKENIITQDPFEQTKNLLKNTLIMQDKWRLQTFKNYLYLYNKSNLTVKNYILDVRHFLTWVEQTTIFTDLKGTNKENVFSNINNSKVNEYKKLLLEHQFSPRTINRKLSSIRQYLKWSIEEKLTRNIESPPIFNLEKPLTRYSRFPPFRLIQKTIRGTGILIDISLIIPLVHLTRAMKSISWKIKGKEIFSGSSPSLTEKTSLNNGILSLPKSLYAPLSISTRNFPLHEKVWHQLRHNRPHWYKKYHSLSISHYFHLIILILFISQLSFVVNQRIILPQSQPTVLGTLESMPVRILTFAGKLSDSYDNPIIGSAIPVRMSIYNDETASGSSLLWQEIVGINTDKSGNFSTILGNNTPLPQSFFEENHALWLGISVGQLEELVPRESIAGTSLANNTEKLQGLSPITSPHSNTKNVILALDSSGNLTIDGNASPTFQATGGTFKLLGQTLVLSTTPGTNTNVEIAPMDLGKIDLQKPIFNSTNNNNIDMAIGSVEINDSLAVLATTSATSAFVINQNSTGKLISAYASSSAKFAVDNNGDILSQAGSKWQPFSNSTTALNIANAAGNAFVTFDTSNSRIGIGTTAPSFRLDIQDSQNATAAAQIFNTNSDTDADGLIIKLGNTSTSAVATSNHFISFETAGIGIVGSIEGSGGTGIDYRTSGIADFAEYLKKEEGQIIEYGSLICINEKGLVLSCDQINNKIVGIASDQGGFTGGNDLGDSSVRVGFVGQVYTKVSNMNGDIKPGDPLTYSSIPGVAVKATKAGQIVGKSLEASLTCTQSTTNENTKNHEQDSGTSCTGKVLVAISVSWYDPSIYLTSTGDRSVQNTETSKTSTIVSPIPEIDKIHTVIISPLASFAPTDLRVPQSDIVLEIQNASGSAVATIDSLENASFSGTLDPNVSSTSAIIHDSEFPSTSSSLSFGVEDLSSGPKGMIPNSNFEGLIAFGPTSLSDTSITGQLSIGATILQDNSINTIGTVLELQPLRQGALSLMGGLVYIDTDGNLKVDGNVHFAQNVSVDGDLVASGSATINKLNLSIAKNAFAVSSKELIATGSAGQAFVRAREAEITINNKLVTDKSLIFITPAGTPSGQIPFLLRQVPDGTWLRQQSSDANSSQIGSFTVGIASSSAKNTPFNWLIIN